MKKKKLTALGMVSAMMAIMCVPVAAAPSNVTAKEYTLTFMADPTVVSSGLVYEPVNYIIPATVPKNTTLGALLKENKVEFQGNTSYITGFKCADAKGFTLSQNEKAKFPAVAFDSRMMVDPASLTGQDEWLSEKEGTGYAGWMAYVDNQTSVVDASQPYGTYYYSLNSTIEELEKYGILDDGNVTLEMFFSLDMGADIGMNDSYLPETITNENGYLSYNWNGPFKVVSKIAKADRTKLVQAMASHPDSVNYSYALDVLKNLESHQREIDFCVNDINKSY